MEVTHNYIYNNEVKGYRLRTKSGIFDTDVKTLKVLKDTLGIDISKSIDVEMYLDGDYFKAKNLKDVEYVSFDDLVNLHDKRHMVGTDLDLYSRYLKFNKAYFNNSLPLDVKVYWSGKLKAAGVCNYKTTRKYISKGRYEKNGLYYYDFEIALSRMYHNKYDDIDGTLIHEMIHISVPHSRHNGDFKKIMDYFNSAYGLNITAYIEEDDYYNYLYSCINCAKKYKRMRRLDTKKYCCSKCKGELILIEEK